MKKTIMFLMLTFTMASVSVCYAQQSESELVKLSRDNQIVIKFKKAFRTYDGDKSAEIAQRNDDYFFEEGVSLVLIKLDNDKKEIPHEDVEFSQGSELVSKSVQGFGSGTGKSCDDALLMYAFSGIEDYYKDCVRNHLSEMVVADKNGDLYKLLLLNKKDSSYVPSSDFYPDRLDSLEYMFRDAVQFLARPKKMRTL